MVTYRQVVVVARIIRGLCAGRNGEDLVAEVRALPVNDPPPVFKTVTVAMFVTAVAFGVAKVAVKDEAPLTAAVHNAHKMSMDL